MMSVDERARHELYLSIEDLIGAEKAETLMSLLPPVGWADVATTHDLDALRAATKHDIEASELRLEAKLHREIASQTRAIMFGLVTTVVTMGGLNLTAIFTLR